MHKTRVSATPLFAIFLAVLYLLFCHGWARAESTVLRLEGSTTLLPMLQKLTADFRRTHPGVEFELKGGGSGRGIEALLQGDIEIAASSRFINSAEISRSQDNGIFPVPFHVAYDAIIPIVRKRNPVKSLSLAQLGKIYRGEIDNWRQLGGEDRRVVAVMRDADSGTYQVWQERVAGGQSNPAEAVYAGSTADVAHHVANHRGDIGYIGLASLNASVKPLRVEGVMGSLRNVRSGSYSLSRPLFLFTTGWPEGPVLEFINFALNPDAGQLVVEAEGFVPLYRREGH